MNKQSNRHRIINLETVKFPSLKTDINHSAIFVTKVLNLLFSNKKKECIPGSNNLIYLIAIFV